MIDDVSPQATWQALEENSAAQLIDVRTPAEWLFVGMPDVSQIGRAVHPVSWQLPGGLVNSQFLEELSATGATEGQPLYFICRSGSRSRAAAKAAKQAGFGPVFNVADGFEGPLDAHSHRGGSAGWKAAGLPWQQH
ncbi:rhodanese-like domain-containing protein [Acetobacter fallax]|uniref:Rhodanese-like domain-containing protein n=1 Tax=Acetobacter fallax TaxID=1737473 RepID=A0ABX0K574_9PROT|nr:rhodanese-like domain-containing protein [Acetobacter fallax]NHO31040.1 rhodanese-like domain-containing protein [Acetobacter fallax]NHO34597.1 rhodanese-like domain-containing protein [Acetobacter fallax]